MNETTMRADDIDRLGNAFITMAQELWVLKDRQRVLERMLTDAGLLADDAVDSHQPDATLQAQLAAERERFIGALIAALTAGE